MVQIYDTQSHFPTNFPVKGFQNPLGQQGKSIFRHSYAQRAGEGPFHGIQTGCLFPLTLIAEFKANQETEKDPHKQYQSNGEWFKLEGELKKTIAKFEPSLPQTSIRAP